MTPARPLFLVCGVRPHYVKLAGLRHVLVEADPHLSVACVDARQHFDPELTDIFLDDLGISPDHTIAHESEDAHDRGGRIYSGLCSIFEEEASTGGREPAVAVFGDVTTTAMAALAAGRIGCPLIHIEAGVRSQVGVSGESVENRIRRVTAQLSSLNLCVLPTHVGNLDHECAPGRSAWVGDLSRDFLLSRIAASASASASACTYVLVHIHKAENVTIERIRLILGALSATRLPVEFIVHPSVRRLLEEHGIPALAQSVTMTGPMNYTKLVDAMGRARVLLTDSGGIQREAYYLRRRCVVRRDTVGWSELIQGGGHVRVGADEQEMADALLEAWAEPEWLAGQTPSFWKEGGTIEAAALIHEVLNE